jgi:hypothetical protein
MDIIIKGGPIPSTTFGSALIPLIIDPTFGAGRSVLKPEEYNSVAGFNGGHYAVARSVTGVTGVASGGALVSLRWALGTGEVLIKRVAVGAQITTAFTTAQAVDFDVVMDRGFTVADSGGTAVTPILGNNQKMRQKLMATSQMNDFRETSGAALTAGTKTADASAFGIGAIQQNNTIGSGFGLLDLYKHDKNAEHPQMVGNNEGINIRIVTSMAAAGVIRFYYVVEWAEVPGL